MRISSLPSLALAAALVLGACSKPEPPPNADEIFDQVDALLDAADGAGALAVLTTAELPDGASLADDPRYALMFAEANILAGQWGTATEALVAIEDEDMRLALRADICALQAFSHLDDNNREAALEVLVPCGGDERIDLRVLRLAVQQHPRADALMAEIAALPEAGDGPEVTAAAELLERIAAEQAEAAPVGPTRLGWYAVAYQVASSDAWIEPIVSTVREGALALAERDPDAAIEMYEHLTMARIPGFTAPEEDRAWAERQTRDLLLPTFRRNFERRYERKFEERDTELGIWDPDTQMWTITADDERDLDTALRDFIYLTYERPYPEPSPQFLEIADICHDRSQPCTFGMDVMVDWLWNLIEYETARGEELGVELTWHREMFD